MAHRCDPAFGKALSPALDNGPVDSSQDTRIAMYSAEDGASTDVKGKGRAIDLPDNFVGTPSSTSTVRALFYPHAEEDPFAGPSAPPGLSPMASAFQPAHALYQQDDGVADFLSTDFGLSRLIEVSGGSVTVTVAEVAHFLTVRITCCHPSERRI